MEFSEGWKSVFPIGASTVSPLLLSDSDSDSATLGPLLFNPNPNSLTLLFSSVSLIPPLHIPPYLSLPRFLLSTRPCSILPSDVSSVASSVGPNHEYQNDNASYFCRNRIHLLKYPDRPNTVVLFPTGEADEKVGFFTLRVKDSVLDIQLDSNGDVFRASSGSLQRILTISVNAFADFGPGESGFESNSSFDIGHLLASARHFVYWFTVKHDSILDRPRMNYLGCKEFMTSPVVHACWSPHILEQSLVLLESGQLFLFDLDLETHGSGTTFKGTRLRVPWDDFNCSENKAWLSCEFSYGPKILIVARSDAVFLVKLHLQLEQCIVTCLMKIETLRTYAPDENERFLALSRAGPDNSYFTLASSSLLLLCDVNRPMEPVLQWVHGIDGPCHITALSLSMLRSHSKEDTFKLASESGFCIILGSFWNCEFSIFCYGSALSFRKGSIASKLSKINKTFYAWELPFEINLSSRGCHRGNSLLREDLSKGALPKWIDWQLKREMVLGFGILSNDLAALLCEPDEHGGFTLIRWMSSGTFELQRYHASWDLAKKLEDCHEPVLCFESPLLYPTSNKEYKFKKEFDYLKFDYLAAYAEDNLFQILVAKREKCKLRMDAQEEEPFCAEVHELLCEKLNACGFGQSRSCPAITAVFKDVKLPTSFHEVALRRLWTDLPLELLQLAFLSYSECREFIGNSQHRVALEFLAVPDLPQLPPFFLRQSSRHCNDDIVGPVIPFPVLLVLNEVRYGCSDLGSNDFSIEAELGLKYKEVMQVAGEIAVSCHGSMRPGDHAVSLADDREETWVDSLKPKTFSSYRPVAFNCSATDIVQGNSVYGDAIYDTFIFHVSEKSCEQTESVGQEMFDDLCPIELRFDAPVKKFEHQGLKAYNLLKRQMTKWHGSFDLYKEFCIQSGFEKVVNR